MGSDNPLLQLWVSIKLENRMRGRQSGRVRKAVEEYGHREERRKGRGGGRYQRERTSK